MCPKPTLTHYKRVTKYPDGGLLSLSLASGPAKQTNNDPDSPGNAGSKPSMHAPTLLSFTPTALRIGWKNPFPGAPPLEWSEVQLSNHPRDWNNETRTLRFKDGTFQTLVSGLEPDSRCFVRVRVRRNGTTTSWSYPPLEARTEPVRPPDSTKEMRVTTPSAALKSRVEWDKVYAGGSKKGITGFEVRAHALDKDGNWKEQYWRGRDGKTMQAVVSGIQPSSAFRVSVRAKNEAGWGDWGPEFEFMSGPKVEYPETIDWRTMKISEPQQHSFKVEWQAPKSVGAWIENYCLQFGTDGLNWSPHYTTKGDTTKLLLTDLQPGTLYYVRAKAKNALGWGRFVFLLTLCSWW